MTPKKAKAIPKCMAELPSIIGSDPVRTGYYPDAAAARRGHLKLCREVAHGGLR